MQIIEGELSLLGDEKIAIISSRFNHLITDRLVEGAKDCFLRHGGIEENLTHILVPGAFEIPLLALKCAKTHKYNAIITLGAIIKGSTSHYDYVCAELTKGIAQVALQTEVPVLFGVLTTENIEQAIERAGTKAGNKGSEAAKAAIEMANLIKTI